MSQLKHEGTSVAFASPIFSYAVPHANELNALLTKEAHAIRKTSAGMSRSNQNGWHSEEDLFLRKEKGIAQLCQHIMGAFKHACLAVDQSFPVSDYTVNFSGWININGKGAYNAPHSHPHNHWSGCYYVNQPAVEHGRAGMIEFMDPRTNPTEMKIFKGTTFAQKIQVRPSAGTLLVFPSYLMHWVYPNEAEEERISIAWNGQLVRKGQ